MTILIVEQKFEPIEMVMHMFSNKKTKDKYRSKERWVKRGMFLLLGIIYWWMISDNIVAVVENTAFSFF